MQNIKSINIKSINFGELSAAEVGHLLNGFGVNLLVREVARGVAFLRDVLQFNILRADVNYALLNYNDHYFQLHADATYAAHPLLAALPEVGARGGGVELQVYQTDPDQAEQRARANGYAVLQSARDKPHGLRECFLLDADGYCWVPSIRIVSANGESPDVESLDVASARADE